MKQQLRLWGVFGLAILGSAASAKAEIKLISMGPMIAPMACEAVVEGVKVDVDKSAKSGGQCIYIGQPVCTNPQFSQLQLGTIYSPTHHPACQGTVPAAGTPPKKGEQTAVLIGSSCPAGFRWIGEKECGATANAHYVSKCGSDHALVAPAVDPSGLIAKLVPSYSSHQINGFVCLATAPGSGASCNCPSGFASYDKGVPFKFLPGFDKNISTCGTICIGGAAAPTVQ